MTEMRASVLVDLAGNLEREAKKFQQALGRVGTRGARDLGRIEKPLSRIQRGLSSLGNRYTALAGGLIGAATIRRAATLEERLTRIGISLNKPQEEIDRLDKKIRAIAQEAHIRVDAGQITSAVEAIAERTGDMDFIRENIENIALAIQATGGSGTAIGSILAEMQKMDIRKPEAVLAALDKFNVQGKEGAFTFKNLAALGPRVVTAYTALRGSSPEALGEMGAVLQMVMRGTGVAETAATAFEALLRTLQDADKIKVLQEGGIQVFDPKALAEGREVLRPINELYLEIIQAAGGKSTILSQVFDAEALRAFNAGLTEFNRTGALPSLEKFMAVQVDGTQTLLDAARAAETANAAMQQLQTTYDRFAKEDVLPLVQGVTGRQIGPEAQLGILRGVVVGGATGAAAGLPLAGVGAVPGAVIGSLIGAFSGALGLFQDRPSAAARGNPAAPEGRVVVEVLGNARVKSVEARGMALEANSGLIMDGGN